jgi:hypothetical protein
MQDDLPSAMSAHEVARVGFRIPAACEPAAALGVAVGTRRTVGVGHDEPAAFVAGNDMTNLRHGPMRARRVESSRQVARSSLMCLGNRRNRSLPLAVEVLSWCAANRLVMIFSPLWKI